jgi:hypothetical protein
VGGETDGVDGIAGGTAAVGIAAGDGSERSRSRQISVLP